MTPAELISTVFAPELFVLVATLGVVGLEVRHDGRGKRALAVRTVAVVAAWTLALVVYQGGQTAIPTPVPGGEDFFASVGLIVGFGVIWLVWRRRGWEESVQAYAVLLVGTSMVHGLVVPLWNVSSHVLYATVPSVYLSTLDRRFAVLLVVPLALVWSRVALNTHTVAESAGALVVGVAIGIATTATLRSRFR